MRVHFESGQTESLSFCPAFQQMPNNLLPYLVGAVRQHPTTDNELRKWTNWGLPVLDCRTNKRSPTKDRLTRRAVWSRWCFDEWGEGRRLLLLLLNHQTNDNQSRIRPCPLVWPPFRTVIWESGVDKERRCTLNESWTSVLPSSLDS